MHSIEGAGAESVFADRFVIEKEAARGGMGIVYRAFDRVDERIVALKVLHKTEPIATRRLEMEADALGKLDHPDIVRYLAHGVSGEGVPYLVLEWLEGESLRTHLARTAKSGELLELEDVLELGQRLAGALAAAHAVGIVHRDVKPSNVLLVGGSLRRPKLVDFGVVRAPSDEHLTTTGTAVGTIGYMAPEQARGIVDVDGRADLFSLGCVLFRCLANHDAFEGSDPMTVLSNLLLHVPPRIGTFRADVPPDLDDLIARLLAKERSERPSSATDVQQALTRIGTNLSAPTQPIASPARIASPVRKTAIETPARTRRLRLLVAAAGALVATAIVLASPFRSWRTAPASPAVTPSATAPAGTAVTALPISSGCAPAATALYAQAMQTMREGRWYVAHSLFEQAAQADGSCPQIQLRRLMTSYGSVSATLRHERIRDVVRLRDALSTRDRFLLDAFAIEFDEDVPRRAEANRIFEEALRQFPMDAELLYLSSLEKLVSERSAEELESALRDARKAALIDPAYSDAWQIQAKVFDRLGRDDEQRAALDQCLIASPGSSDCMGTRIFLLRRLGRCEEAAEGAKTWTTWEPTESHAYEVLAASLAGTRAPREAIEHVLLIRWNRLPDELREPARLLEGATLEAWAGDFAGALRTAERLQSDLAGSGGLEPNWSGSMVSVDALVETGDAASAARIAEQALRRKDAWTQTDERAVDAAPSEAWLLAAAFQGGRLTRNAWRKAAEDWERANSASLNDVERWIFRWGTAVDSPADAAEAMSHAPAGELRGTMRGFNIAWRIGLLDAYAGRIHLQAGDAAGAAPLLEKSANACQGFNYPFLNVRTHLWLGMAKEKLGDTDAACAAYQFVLDRWGHAKPPSVTAREAERRSRALACKR